MMGKIFKWFLLIPVFFLAGCDQQSGQTWNASLPWSIKEYHTTNAFAFADAAREATGGSLEIKVFPGGVLGFKGPETLRALEEGLIDMADVPAVQEAGNEPILAMESLPFLIQTQDELRTLYRLIRPLIEKSFAEQGLKVLYIVPWPRQNIYTKTRVTSLDDLRGMKIRTYDRNSSEMMTLLGLTPLQMPSGDVVPALASGMVDAVMTSTTTAAAQQYWEFLPYIYRTNHLWLSNIMSVRLASWNELSETDKKAIEGLASKMEEEFWKIAREDDLKKLDILIKNGMEVVELNEQLMIDMRKESRPMWDQYSARAGPEIRAILGQFLRLTDKDGGA